MSNTIHMDINNFFSFLSSIDVLGSVYVCMVTVQCDSKWKDMEEGAQALVHLLEFII